jgi:uncharacterized protein YdeI (YjbR/CyaY-like superfamily)
MSSLIQLHFLNRTFWRQWLQKNHSTSKGIWMVYYKKGTSVKSISYDDSVEEALCFGWIDSIIKKIDEEKYVRKFTPRTNTTKWSDLNIKRIQKLIKEGRMNEAGLKKVDYRIIENIENRNKENPENKKPFVLPRFITDFFKDHPPALENFKQLAPTYQKHYVLWITNAKQDATIHKRLLESVSLLKENKKLGLK